MTSKLFPIDDFRCKDCKGECFVKDNNSKTQQNALKRFGVIPNNCVNSNNGEIHCPFNS